MRKKVLTITLTILLFLSVAALAVSTVFRVERVGVIARLTAQAGVSAEDLQKELQAAYEKDSTFSVDKDKAEEIVGKYPYLRITGFEKNYPDGLVITVVEDCERYAVESANGYYILNAEGVVVEFRAEANNRLDNAPNVLLKNLTLSGEVGGTLSGDPTWNSMLTLCNAMDKALGGIRKNVVSMEVWKPSSKTYYSIAMREGVKVYVEEPSLLTEEKAKSAVDKYLSLTDEERMTGRITVHVIEGVAIAEYKKVDEF